MHWAYGGGQRQRQLMLINECLLFWTRVWPRRLSDTNQYEWKERKEGSSTKNEHIIKQ